MNVKGSQYQLREYVNRYPNELHGAIVALFPELESRTIEWRAPLERDEYIEPQDRAFLSAIGREDLMPQLKDFWPKGGPVWDALAVLDPQSGGRAGRNPRGRKGTPGGVLRRRLAGEGSECRREDPHRARADATMGGHHPDPDRWIGPLYQSANRYAHLYWLREVARVDAWLVHVLFLDDMTHNATSRDAWDAALPQIERELGLAGVHVPHAGHVFLPAT